MGESKKYFGKLVGNFSLLAFSTAITLVIAEFGFRAAMHYRWLNQVAEWEHPLYESLPDNPIAYRLKANTARENTIRRTGAKWSYEINSFGYRDDEFNLDDDGYRVVFLGDSYTFGWAVDQHETLPSHVEQWFSDSRPELKVDALNLGVPGYNTIHEFHHLQQNIDRFKPDLVVLIYVMNDIEPQHNRYPRPSVTYEYVNIWMLAFIKEQINHYFFDGKEKLRSGANTHSGDYLVAFNENGPKLAAARKAFADIASLCNEKGVPLLVVIFPGMAQRLDHRYKYGPIHAEVRNWSHEYNIDFIDLYEYFAGASKATYTVKGDGHPNSKAFAKASKLISPIIEGYLN